MVYAFEITTPKLGDVELPLVTVIPVTKGRIRKLVVVFPPGSMGLLHLTLHREGHQVFPHTPGQVFRGDNVRLDFDEEYLLLDEPLDFTAQTKNYDTVHPHTVFFYFNILREELMYYL